MNSILLSLISLFAGIAIAYIYFHKRVSELNIDKAQLKTTLDEKEKNYIEKLEFVDKLRSQVNTDFKSLASDILEKDRDKLKNDNSELLTPLQSQLNSFREG